MELTLNLQLAAHTNRSHRISAGGSVQQDSPWENWTVYRASANKEAHPLLEHVGWEQMEQGRFVVMVLTPITPPPTAHRSRVFISIVLCSCWSAQRPRITESSALEPPWANGHKAIRALVEQRNYGKGNYGKPIAAHDNKAVLVLVDDLESASQRWRLTNARIESVLVPERW